MQTFLPHPEFAESAAALDPRRLGKQRAETIQVLRPLTVPGYGWRHHPAAAMWSGYEEALTRYGLTVCTEWVNRGHTDASAATLLADLRSGTGLTDVRDFHDLRVAGEVPPWLGDPDFHRSHQSSLVRKDPTYYRPLFPDVADNLPYIWSSSDRERRIPLHAS